jgi:phage I-like protein
MNFNDLVYSGNLSLYALSSTVDKLAKVKVAVLGKWDGHSKGSFEVDKKSMDEMLANFNNQSIDTVCDYEHQTLTGETAPASGWIKSLAIENDVLYAFVEWTDKAKEMIENKEYKYVSPVYQFNTTDRATNKNIGLTLHSLSLTNRPFLEELGEVVANSSKITISLKKANEDLTNEVKALKSKLDTLNTERIENIVSNAIQDKKLRPEQKQYALNLAANDLENFNTFIASNRIVEVPQSDLYANSSTKGDVKSDIDLMVNIASQQTV